jgi:hypothetical protein
MFKPKFESIFKCWNCHGLGLIPLQDDDFDPNDDDYIGSCVYGDACPICKGTGFPYWLIKIITYFGFNIQS